MLEWLPRFVEINRMRSYPESTAVMQYYVPELQAAAEIGVNKPE
jgi:hypothetical protein